MSLDALNAALADIPLTQSMGLRAVRAWPGVALAVPLGPNTNHQGTAFGGSLHSAAILAGWAWLWGCLRHNGLQAQVVIQKAQSEITAPVAGDFTAFCDGAAAGDLEHLMRMLTRKGRGRLALACRVESGSQVCMKFAGEYVVLMGAAA